MTGAGSDIDSRPLCKAVMAQDAYQPQLESRGSVGTSVAHSTGRDAPRQERLPCLRLAFRGARRRYAPADSNRPSSCGLIGYRCAISSVASLRALFNA
jgi:hypothetical protein